MNEETKVKLKYKVPKKVGEAVDLLFKLRSERRALASKAEDARAQEYLMEQALLDKFKKDELEGARGKSALASIKRSDVPVIEDDAKFYAYLRKTGEFDLLERRPAKEACRARWAKKIGIPGVSVFTKVSVNLTKNK